MMLRIRAYKAKKALDQTDTHDSSELIQLVRLLARSPLVYICVRFENLMGNRPVYHWYRPSRILGLLTDKNLYHEL